MALAIKTVNNKPTCWIAYSGGLDSHCLLHQVAMGLQEFRDHYQLKAIHIHHGLSPNADAWSEHCVKTCADLAIPITVIHVTVNPKSNVEASAREARYRVFAEQLQKNDILLTAHHLNDQAETFLLQALRGGGLAGLAAMPRVKNLGQGQHLRPFLSCSRSELQEYAQEHRLSWIEDESNQQIHFDRNLLRNTVMPILYERWPVADITLSRNAAYIGQSLELLADLAKIDLAQCSFDNHALNIEQLNTLSSARQINVLRYWIREAGYRVPGEALIQRILAEVLPARSDAQPIVSWEDAAVRRYREAIYVMDSSNPPCPENVEWSWRKPLLFEGYTLVASEHIGQGIATHKLPEVLTVTHRKGGEQIRPAGSGHHRELKTLFQEWGVPPWQRENIPLIYQDKQLIAVVGYCIAMNWQANSSEKGIVFEWSKA